MKLPTIQYKSGVQSLGREDVYGPLKQAFAISEAININTGALQKAYALYDERRTLIETEERSLNVQKRITRLQKDLANKRYFSAEEVPDEIEVRRTELVVDEHGVVSEVPRKQIPAYEVSPSIYRQVVSNIIEAEAEGITNKNARREWLNAQKETLNKSYAQLSLDSIAAQQDQIHTRQRLNIEEAWESGNFTLARELISGLLASEEEKQELRNQTDIRQELDRYREDMATDDLEALYSDLEFLQAEDYKGHLSQETRLQFVNAIKGHISTLSDQGAAAAKVERALLLNKVERTIDNLNRGINISPSFIVDLGRKLSVYADDPTAAVKLERLNYASKAAPDVRKFMRQPAHVRQRVLNQYDKAQKDDIAADHFYNLQQAHERQLALERNDAISAALHTGAISSKDFKPLDYNKLGESLQARIPVAEQSFQQTGRFTGFLTEAEAFELAGRIEQMDLNQQVQLMAQIEEGLGDQAPYLYEQLKLKQASPVFAAAGQAAVEGDRVAADTILRGHRFLATKEGSNAIQPIQTDMREHLAEQLQGAYENDPQRYDSVGAAFRAAYAWLAYQERDYTWNDNIADKALRMATGGLVEFAGRRIELPDRTMSGQHFKSWIRGLHHSAIGLMGEPHGWTRKQLLDRIKDEDIELRNVGHGAYLVIQDGQPVRQKTGDMFIFYYDKDLPTVEQVKREEEAERRAEEGMRKESEREYKRDTPNLLWPNLGQNIRKEPEFGE